MTWEVLTVRSKWAEDDVPQATSTSPRFLPFRIKANGECGVFDSLTGETAPFGDFKEIPRIVRGTAKDLNNGAPKQSVGWMGAGHIYE